LTTLGQGLKTLVDVLSTELDCSPPDPLVQGGQMPPRPNRKKGEMEMAEEQLEEVKEEDKVEKKKGKKGKKGKGDKKKKKGKKKKDKKK
jgi:hypothetical protein